MLYLLCFRIHIYKIFNQIQGIKSEDTKILEHNQNQNLKKLIMGNYVLSDLTFLTCVTGSRSMVKLELGSGAIKSTE